MANALGKKKKKNYLKCIDQRTTKDTWQNMTEIKMGVMGSALIGASPKFLLESISLSK